jgi:CheY-like chemotaxis protein
LTPLPTAHFDETEPGPAPAVLLVDDDEVNLLLTSLALRERGFNITEASGGEQALACWPNGPPTSSCSTR